MFSYKKVKQSKTEVLTWYTKVSPLTVVWVANRNKPLDDKSGLLKLNENGIHVLLNATNNTIWSSNISSNEGNNPTAHLLDSGNFVVKNGQETNSFLWQSFDEIGDTMIPGMKLGWNLETGLERYISSWNSDNDPAEGKYALKLDLRGYPEIIIFKGPDIKSRKGSWNGLSVVAKPTTVPEISQNFVINEKEVYYEYDLVVPSIFRVHKLTPSGTVQSLYWTTQRRTLQVTSTGEEDQCENYAFCGSNSICSSDGNRATCECLRGYVPKSPDQWNIAVWFEDCVSRNKSNCNNSYTDGFLTYTHLKLPDTSSSWFNRTMNLDECRKSCLKNCSCKGYANLDIRDGGSGCLLWFNSLVDMRKFSQSGQDLYIRVPASELDHGGHGNIKKKIVEIAVGMIIFGLVICVCIFIIKNPVLANATEKFSTKNKLGEGGFGPVFKGKLIDGQEFAVKRLSKKSEQGLEEFKNEVALIAKLQHRNLVKLLGCCIEGEEKMLIYEYMPNQSLDYFVFGRSSYHLF
ncbi:G-type lectin S-receptor-like serine/threonine-protein kinase At4g27290 [Cajanus cajan]|uniref:G-type lectin S-receptor-like serine/threonine-protein kinase At4g27290 n=1 Tax=Cajanus cajan TaxID=3821 RepID=UPI0010FB26C2|nr:G-type lectin S-receptor-like serine/threonine-protein kinase At4g27290 [Cajanus cajan]